MADCTSVYDFFDGVWNEDIVNLRVHWRFLFWSRMDDCAPVYNFVDVVLNEDIVNLLVHCRFLFLSGVAMSIKGI